MRRVLGDSTLIVVVCVAAGFSAASSVCADETLPKGAPIDVVALTAREPESGGNRLDGNGDPYSSGGKLLVRELLRQATLIAARDQLGLATRDMALREGIAGGAKLIEAQTTETIGQSVHLVLSMGAGERRKILFDREIPLPRASEAPFDYVAFSAAVEAWSRADLVQALYQARLDGKENPQSPDIRPAAATLARLNEMNIFSQFAAARELHELQRTQGESAATLGALARAYAHLGQLTSFHWNASHKVFKARSLLYAQRLLQADKHSPAAFRHRAYVLALAGLHGAALEDLKAAGESKPGDDKGPPSAGEAPWVPMIDAFCRYDLKALQEMKPADAERELHALLSYAAIENCGAEAFVLTRGAETLQIAPECYRVAASMSRYTGVGDLYRATIVAPTTLDKTLANRLQAMLQLPSAVKEVIAAQPLQPVTEGVEAAWMNGRQRQAIIKSLLAAGAPDKDRQEPSWIVAARMLEDANFSQVHGRLAFLTVGLEGGKDADEKQRDLALTAVGDHPYLPIIKAVSMNAALHPQELEELAPEVRIVDADLAMAPYFDLLNYVPVTRPYGNQLWQGFLRHMDDLSNDSELEAIRAKDAQTAHRLAKSSPQSPQAVMLLVDYDAAFAAPRLAAWKEEYADHPGVLQALVNYYEKNKKPRDALAAMEAYVKISPDPAAFVRLADMYWKQRQPAAWRKTLEASLAHDGSATVLARTRFTLARYHFERKEFEKAVAYADANAPFGTIWALQCATECHAALEQWDQAEAYIRELSARNPQQAFDWYFWCRRTGHGDVAAAKEWALPQARRFSASKDAYEQEMTGVFYELIDDTEAARAAFQKSLDLSVSVNAALYLILMGDAKGDKRIRDKPLIQFATMELYVAKSPPGIQEFVALIRWLRNAYKQPADAEPDLATIEELLKTPAPKDKALIAFFVGKYFSLHNRPELARKYLKRSVAIAEFRSEWYMIQAAILLQDLPPDPEEKK